MHSDEKGQSTCLVMLGNTLVHVACKKQKIVTKHLTESELVALADFLLEGELVGEFIMEMGTLMDDDFITQMFTWYIRITSQ